MLIAPIAPFAPPLLGGKLSLYVPVKFVLFPCVAFRYLELDRLYPVRKRAGLIASCEREAMYLCGGSWLRQKICDAANRLFGDAAGNQSGFVNTVQALVDWFATPQGGHRIRTMTPPRFGRPSGDWDAERAFSSATSTTCVSQFAAGADRMAIVSGLSLSNSGKGICSTSLPAAFIAHQPSGGFGMWCLRQSCGARRRRFQILRRGGSWVSTRRDRRTRGV